MKENPAFMSTVDVKGARAVFFCALKAGPSFELTDFANLPKKRYWS